MLAFQIYFSLMFIIFTILFWDSYDKRNTLGSISSGIGLIATLLLLQYLQATQFFVK